jgi:hypothetical protein
MLLVLVACKPEEPKVDPCSGASAPLDMKLARDGQLYAGAGRVDITPTDFETYSDLNENHRFDGCLDYPDGPNGGRAGCDEPFDDRNGNGQFDGVWMAGFGDFRAAQSVHDPITVTAVVLALDEEYVALVGVDALGLLENRTRDARDQLAEQCFDRDRVVISSSHSHQGPDTVGIYGDVTALYSGVYEPFIESIVPGIVDAVTAAAGSMEAVTPAVGAVELKADSTLNGGPFGGINPDPSMVGGVNDIRDPIIEADQVLEIALDGAGGRVATIVNNSGHPEAAGDDNDALSADYAGVIRDWIEAESGGTTVFLSGALGGMQSPLGGTLPTVDEAGARVMEEDGVTPVWDETGSGFEFAREYGTIVAQAAQAAATDTQPWDAISVRHAEYLIAVDNVDFKLAFQVGILDTPDEYIVRDGSCPGFGTDNDVFGCVPTGSWRIDLGPVSFGSVPGELFPELFWGVPDDAAMADASLRLYQDSDGTWVNDKRWVQADPDCVAVDWPSQCSGTDVVQVEDCDGDGSVCDGVCECLHSHTAPYTINDGDETPIADFLTGTYRAPIGIANGYCGYIVPSPDFNTYASQLTEDGDHYEETNSCGKDFAPTILEAFAGMYE